MFRVVENIFRYVRICVIGAISCCFSKKLSFCPNCNCLIIAPHPDDEVLGCGGLISRLVMSGNIPHILIMTGGESSHNGCCTISPDEVIEARRNLTFKSMTILGVPESNIHLFSYKDGRICFEDKETVRLADLLSLLNPDVVFVPHWGEGWPDHIQTRDIAIKLLPENVLIYEYCVWMWYYNVWDLDWKNSLRFRMTNTEHCQKLRAVNQYVAPLAPCGNPWSGVLPPIFLKANMGKNELYFRKEKNE